jgi:hypothetical protein
MQDGLLLKIHLRIICFFYRRGISSVPLDLDCFLRDCFLLKIS